MKIKIYHIKHIKIKTCSKCGRKYLPVNGKNENGCMLCYYNISDSIDLRTFQFWDWINN